MKTKGMRITNNHSDSDESKQSENDPHSGGHFPSKGRERQSVVCLRER